MNRTFSLLLALFLSLYGVGPMAADNRSQARVVFNNDVSAVPFRIPALAVTRDGRILAVCDYRISKTDIGYSNRNGLFQINEVMRTSADGGRTWSDSVVVARGNEHAAEEWRTAFGDPALVADRNSNEVLMSCVSGKAGYFAATRNHPQHAAFFRSLDGGRTWDKGTDLTEQISRLTLNDLRAFHAKYIKDRPLIVTISGNAKKFDPDAVAKLLGPNVKPIKVDFDQMFRF